MIKKIVSGLIIGCSVFIISASIINFYEAQRSESLAAKEIQVAYETQTKLTDHEIQSLYDRMQQEDFCGSTESFIQGYIALQTGDTVLARDHFKDAVNQVGNRTPHFVKLYSHKFLADSLIRENRYDEAIYYLDEVAKLFKKEDYNEAYSMVWEILSTSRNVPRQISNLTQQVQAILDNNNLTEEAQVYFYRKLTATSILDGKYFKAMEYIIKTLNLAKTEEMDYYKGKVLVDLAIIAKDLDAQEQAIRILESINVNVVDSIQKADLEVYKLVNLAQNQTDLGMHNEALETLDQVNGYIKDLPQKKQEEAKILQMVNRAAVYLGQENLSEAKNIVVDLQEDYAFMNRYSYPNIYVDYLKVLGQLYIEEQLYEEAKEIYTAIVENNYQGKDYDDYRDALEHLMFVDSMLGNFDEVEKTLAKFNEFELDYRNIQFEAVYEYIKAKQQVSAFATYSEKIMIRNIIYFFALSSAAFLFFKINIIPWVKLKRKKRQVEKYLQQDDYFLVYQPIIDPKKNQVVGLEALLRLKVNDQIIYPNVFIPDIHDAKMMGDIALWEVRKIKQSYHELKSLTNLLDPNAFYISLNVSFEEVQDKAFINQIIEEATDLINEGAVICLEITEGIRITEKESVKQHVTQLIEAGFKIAIDDFGVEYSNISLLDQFDFHTIKLDKHFMDNVKHSVVVKNLMKVLNELSEELDISIVIEGVEEEWQKDIIKTYSSNLFYIQGYYYSKPIMIHELKDLKLFNDE